MPCQELLLFSRLAGGPRAASKTWALMCSVVWMVVMEFRCFADAPTQLLCFADAALSMLLRVHSTLSQARLPHRLAPIPCPDYAPRLARRRTCSLADRGRVPPGQLTASPLSALRHGSSLRGIRCIEGFRMEGQRRARDSCFHVFKYALLLPSG